MTKQEWLEGFGIKMSGSFDRNEEADEAFKESIWELVDRFEEIYRGMDDEDEY